MPKSKSSIPDRWMDYSNIGGVIEGTQFIAFKVPLKETISVPEGLKFTPKILLETLFGKNHELGLLVDLTNTTRYYDKTEFEKNGVLYKKIFVPGHVVPTDDIFESFSYAIDSFLEENGDSLVGVHCTHGVNRTGYMVCRYMIEKLDVDPEEAIKAYGKARGYKIERENYLEDLRKRGRGKTSSGELNGMKTISQEQFCSPELWNNDRPSQVHPQYNPYNRFAGHRSNFGPGRYRGREHEPRNSSIQERQFGSNDHSHKGRKFNSYHRGYQGRQKVNNHGGYQWRDGYQGRPYNNDYGRYQGRQVNYGHGGQWERQSNFYHSGYQGTQFEVDSDSQHGGEYRYNHKSHVERPGKEHEPFSVTGYNQRPHSDGNFRFKEQFGNVDGQAENLNDSSEHFHEEPRESTGSVRNRKRNRRRKRKPAQQASD